MAQKHLSIDRSVDHYHRQFVAKHSSRQTQHSTTTKAQSSLCNSFFGEEERENNNSSSSVNSFRSNDESRCSTIDTHINRIAICSSGILKCGAPASRTRVGTFAVGATDAKRRRTQASRDHCQAETRGICCQVTCQGRPVLAAHGGRQGRRVSQCRRGGKRREGNKESGQSRAGLSLSDAIQYALSVAQGREVALEHLGAKSSAAARRSMASSSSRPTFSPSPASTAIPRASLATPFAALSACACPSPRSSRFSSLLPRGPRTRLSPLRRKSLLFSLAKLELRSWSSAATDRCIFCINFPPCLMCSMCSIISGVPSSIQTVSISCQ
jgi:hypothetical protein